MKGWPILALGFLVAGLAPTALAQDKEAEKLFRDMEKKIKEAKAIKIVFTFQLDGKRATGSLLLTKDDKGRVRASGHYYPGVEGNPSFELVSDGKRFKTKGAEIGVATTGVPKFEPGGETAGDTGKGFHAISSVVLSRGGVGYFFYTLPYWIQGTGGVDPDPDGAESKMTVYDFKAGAPEKVGERQAKVLRYRFGKGGKDDAEVTLWIDAENGLPLKRVFSNAKGVFVGRFTETYSEFNVTPKIEGKEFELPK
jgi:outer membrane lipoprotein-sorting protein